MADELQALATGVVHEEERDAVVGGDVARREELAVAGEIGEAEGVRVEELQETARAAPVLNVGPAVGVDRGHVEAVASLNEHFLLCAHLVGAGSRRDWLGPAIGGLLREEDIGGEGGVDEVVGHGDGRWTAIDRSVYRAASTK